MSPKVLETTVAVQSTEIGSAWSSVKMSTLPEGHRKHGCSHVYEQMY